MSLWRRIPTPLLFYRAYNQDINKRTLQSIINTKVNITSSLTNSQGQYIYFNSIRCKSRKNKYDSDDEDDVADDDRSLSKDSKVVKFSTTSMRTDTILKSALGVARNKIEQSFYESKIRVNGKKIMKKSASVTTGDEIDIVKMISPTNPEHLYVSRIEILNVTATEESITVTARRFKNLLIENYQIDPYKGSIPSDS